MWASPSVSRRLSRLHVAKVSSIRTEDIYRCLFAESADGMVISDRLGRITDCNPAISRIVGKTVEELLGEPLSSIIDLERDKEKEESHPGDPGRNSRSESSDTVADNEGSSARPRMVAVIGKSGAELIMPASHIPVTDADEDVGKEPIGYLTVIYILQASSVQQAQIDFVSTVSHELRTPLTSIKGFADTILRAGERLDVSQQRRYVGIIKEQADRLTRLVEDLLAVSRLESKRLQLTIRSISFAETLERVLMNLSEKSSHHKIVQDIPPGLPAVWADADRLEQILTNLVDNAVKYSLQNTTVTVRAKAVQSTDKPDEELIEFSVTDEGVGIGKEHLPKIFSKFSRLDNPLVRQTEGTGLGLYITRSLVLALGGEIKVASEPGQTTFTVRLPASTYEKQAARGRDLY